MAETSTRGELMKVFLSETIDLLANEKFEEAVKNTRREFPALGLVGGMKFVQQVRAMMDVLER
jgi:hypothetical protein